MVVKSIIAVIHYTGTVIAVRTFRGRLGVVLKLTFVAIGVILATVGTAFRCMNWGAAICSGAP
jgi:hypothetical protein